MRLLAVVVSLVFGLSFCSGESIFGFGDEDDEATPSAVDASTPDAAASVTHDAGIVPDAGAPVDAGFVDAGISEPPPDAGVIDAGVVVDAGTIAVDPDPVLRFVALGDQGKGNDKQRAVGSAIASVCTARGGCAFGILLGDNFYPTGVSGVNDAQWETAFVQPYSAVSFPFRAVLGNHDYGGDGAGYEFWKGQYEVDYSTKNPKWSMPAAHYTFAQGAVDFITLDTNSIVYGRAADQAALMPERLAAGTRPWKFVLGHHPYKSNGPHGNAGKWDGIPCPVPLVGDGLCRVPAGLDFKAFFEAQVCNKADFYLCGHDHSMQDLGKVCGVELVVSGAGANTTTLPGSNPTNFQSIASGFFVFEVTDHRVVLTAFDSTGAQLHTRTITK